MIPHEWGDDERQNYESDDPIAFTVDPDTKTIHASRPLRLGERLPAFELEPAKPKPGQKLVWIGGEFIIVDDTEAPDEKETR